MKKTELTHKEIFESLIDDENIADNVDVCDAYEPDKYGNNILSISFTSGYKLKNNGNNAMLVLKFNKKGRLVKMEMAVCEKGKHNWIVVSSDKFINFKQKFSNKIQ